MEIRFSKHAMKRMGERRIKSSLVRKAIEFPDKVEKSNRQTSTYLVKKLITGNSSREHLLIVVYRVRGREYFVVTVIDTTKIKKYY